jgi:hypothetical protein
VKISKKKYALVAVTLVASLALAGCSSKKSDSDTTKKDSKPTVQATVDATLQKQLNPKAGQAIVPGSISSTVQTGLSAACKAVVDPIRAIQAKYKSGLEVDPKTLNEVAQMRAKAQTACAPQEYTDWYTKEFAGWLYAKAK